MASIIRYARASADVSQNATWSVLSGTEDPGYLATNLAGYDPTAPAKLTTTSGTWVADRGVSPSTSITCIALIHTNIAPGTSVTVKFSANADLSSPTLSSAFTTPALSDNWPVNGYLVVAANASRYVGIVIVTNTVAISIGHIALVTDLLTIDRAQQGLSGRDDIPTWDDETELSVPQNLDLLTRLRSVTFQTSNKKSATPALESWWLNARGINLPFLFIQDITVNECYWMTFAEKFKEVTYQWETAGGGTRTWQIKLKEFGRGMLPTPWLT